mmetsp:Transcript_20062/g.14772  ORF Transcript_20062/g.14772 Transcript_20062/m.14772 type:complete len:216 (-) Transcript_20062:531-1178(-)
MQQFVQVYQIDLVVVLAALFDFLFSFSLLAVDGGLDDEADQFVEHLAEDLDGLVVDVFEEAFEAGLDDAFRNLVVDEQLNDQLHVPEETLLHPELNLLLVVHKQHLLVEVAFLVDFFVELAFECLDLVSLISSGFLHFVELLLALSQQQLLEIHLLVVLVVVLLEQHYAQPHIQLQVCVLSRSLHKYYLGQFVQERWSEGVVLQNLPRYYIEIAL